MGAWSVVHAGKWGSLVFISHCDFYDCRSS
ncbi:hypothetical protein PY546_05775 [Providencia stuartii]|nr:hypothetical protein [Providencia stuartii]